MRGQLRGKTGRGEHEGHEGENKGHAEIFVNFAVSFVTFVFAPVLVISS
jgi:hypothetical protein